MILLLLNWLLAAACSTPFPGMEVGIVVPELPAAWLGASGWEVSWISCDAGSEPLSAAPGTVVFLDLPRAREAAVFCSAVLGDGRSLPYGAPWPQGLAEDGMLHPSASGGYACELAAVLYECGAEHARFDLPRFAREAEARMADPWDIDPGSLAPLVVETRFRADYLEAPDPVAVTIHGIPCRMSPDSPWGTAIEADGSGSALVNLVPGRVSRWFGGGYALSACLSGSGEAAWTLVPSPP